MDAVFYRNLPRCIDNNFPLTLFYCIRSPKLHRSFKMIYLLENSYSICCSLSHIDILLSRCFPGFAFSWTLHVSDYFSSVYQSTFFHTESHFITCYITYLTLLVSIYTIAILSDICKPPSLLSFVNFINVLFTSFSRSLIEILNKNIPKTPLQQTGSIPHLPSLPAAYTPSTTFSIQVTGLRFKSISIRFF